MFTSRGTHLFLDKKELQIIGAPLVEGQNLEGADKGPEALCAAGLEKCSTKLGWDVKPPRHINFQEVFSKSDVDPREDIQRYNDWKVDNTSLPFSTWSAQNPSPSCGSPPVESPTHRNIASAYANVKNSVAVGKGVRAVYEEVRAAIAAGSFPLTLGGDHSVAAGSIPALAEKYKDLGVIWVDAHGDANTPTTSPSLHYHGMPAAHILGWFDSNPPGFEWFPVQAGKGCVDESRFAFIGLRDVDKLEGELLRNSGIHVYTMRDVDRLGVARCIEDALRRIDPNGIRPLHLSVDIDAVDPFYAPGTGTLSRGGLSYREVHYICEEMALTNRLVAMDLVEVNPALDPPPIIPAHGMHGDDPDFNPNVTPTVQLGMELCLSSLGKTIC